MKRLLPLEEEQTLGNEYYNPKDNRTYMSKPYGGSPSSDIEVRLFGGKNGRSVSYGGIMGDFTVESRLKTEGMILQFPTASELGLIKIENRTLKTLTPEWIIERYKVGSFMSHKTPIFYDTKTSGFIIVMDGWFLKDLDINELDITNELRSSIKIYNDKKNKNRQYLGLRFNTINELLDDQRKLDSMFNKIADVYSKYLLTRQEGEKVIVVKYKSRDNEDLIDYNNTLKQIVGKSILSGGMDIEFYKSYKFENTCYILDENEEINRKYHENINFIENHHGLKGYGLDQDKKTILVIAYSDEDWKLLSEIRNRIVSIAEDLNNILLSGKNEGNLLDKPITSLNMNNLLEFKEK
jgi:hypothetical protein